jgi:hypothetical protein
LGNVIKDLLNFWEKSTAKNQSSAEFDAFLRKLQPHEQHGKKKHQVYF